MLIEFVCGVIDHGMAYNPGEQYEIEERRARGFIGAGHAVAVEQAIEQPVIENTTIDYKSKQRNKGR